MSFRKPPSSSHGGGAGGSSGGGRPGGRKPFSPRGGGAPGGEKRFSPKPRREERGGERGSGPKRGSGGEGGKSGSFSRGGRDSRDARDSRDGGKRGGYGGGYSSGGGGGYSRRDSREEGYRPQRGGDREGPRGRFEKRETRPPTDAEKKLERARRFVERLIAQPPESPLSGMKGRGYYPLDPEGPLCPLLRRPEVLWGMVYPDFMRERELLTLARKRFEIPDALETTRAEERALALHLLDAPAGRRWLAEHERPEALVSLHNAIYRRYLLAARDASGSLSHIAQTLRASERRRAGSSLATLDLAGWESLAREAGELSRAEAMEYALWACAFAITQPADARAILTPLAEAGGRLVAGWLGLEVPERGAEEAPEAVETEAPPEPDAAEEPGARDGAKTDFAPPRASALDEAAPPDSAQPLPADAKTPALQAAPPDEEPPPAPRRPLVFVSVPSQQSAIAALLNAAGLEEPGEAPPPAAALETEARERARRFAESPGMEEAEALAGALEPLLRFRRAKVAGALERLTRALEDLRRATE